MCRRYIEAQRAGWKSDKHAEQWPSTIRLYVNPVFGRKTVDQITVEDVLKVLDFMLNYTVTHFTAEEGIQRKYNYPKYLAHKKLHDGFIKEIKMLKDDIDKSGVTVATGSLLGSTLSNWLITHINIEDKALGAHVRGIDGAK